MRADRIIHPGLAKALAELGHTDTVLVTDAGFPIPAGANRIDLGFYPGLPDVLDILRVLRRELFVEQVRFAPEVRTHHPRLYAGVREIFTGAGAPFIAAPHEELIEVWAPRAKVVVRSGSFEPWANFALTASTDPFAWFIDDDVQVLPAYVERRRLMRENVVPDLP
ncbi:D-ribose pyranase [Tessaracoccus sp. OS52]|uniref:D-ribose pyranase n=1 Tax=Tessaracoccus sp. OS52 TaxID=2886691 RepID=UPI001D10F92A|nr:D-ribose pyranase [Tessaracoccus sp. OS52]MCC2591868.1 D-ribose pyranase [Tessaracoccus sp. OS52]